MRRGLADVATSRRRVELQAQQLAAGTDQLQQQAAAAVAAGRDHLAREALTRRASTLQLQADLQLRSQDL